MKRGCWTNVVILLVLSVALVAGCGGGGGEDKNNGNITSTALMVSSAADLAIESASDYNSNVKGLITGQTLQRWKTDWVNQRPAGITGKLIILQVTPGETGFEYIKTNGTTASTYLAATAEWTMTRSNGKHQEGHQHGIGVQFESKNGQ